MPRSISSLDFHHERDKEFRLGMAHAFDWENILLEIDKCTVMCRNCHAIEHFDTSKFDRLAPQIQAKMLNYKEKQSKVNREVIERMLGEGKKQVEIAKYFGCSKSTICDIVHGRT